MAREGVVSKPNHKGIREVPLPDHNREYRTVPKTVAIS